MGWSVCSSGSVVRICLTVVRLVSVPRLLLSVMTIAWDSRLDGG